jgi:hypothetical protein
MGLETDERPSFPEATSSNFGTGRTTTPASWSFKYNQKRDWAK